MPRLQRKNFSTPDEVRSIGAGRVEVVALDETMVARNSFAPGWRWSIDVRPMVHTSSCQIRHVGACISGALRVRCDDGTELDIGAGDAYEIPPGHDAWVIGDEAFLTIEFASARTFGALGDDDEAERILTTVLFTDIVDSTRLVERLGDVAWM